MLFSPPHTHEQGSVFGCTINYSRLSSGPEQQRDQWPGGRTLSHPAVFYLWLLWHTGRAGRWPAVRCQYLDLGLHQKAAWDTKKGGERERENERKKENIRQKTVCQITSDGWMAFHNCTFSHETRIGTTLPQTKDTSMRPLRVFDMHFHCVLVFLIRALLFRWGITNLKKKKMGTKRLNTDVVVLS